ncbi:Flagellar L-ring protein [compost metagenome]
MANVETVPSKIVEKLPDGNYRIKGQQPFMIGKREYKVIVTGLIRPEDFNDEGITSQKLLDPQYDVVSIRRNSRNE